MSRLSLHFIAFTIISIYLGALIACSTGSSPNNADGSHSDEQRYTHFAQQLAESIHQRDPSFFNAHFDFDALINDIVARVDVPDDYKQGFREGIQKELNVGLQIIGALNDEGTYTFLRLKNANDVPTALCRLTTSNGINYHEIQLGKRGDSCYIKDFYIYRGGLDFSATLKRLYFSSLAEVVDSISFEQTSPFDRAFIEHLDDIDQIAALVEEKNYRAALKIADGLPDILRTDKMILVMRTNIAHQVSQEAFDFTLSDFRDHYPSDPIIEFLALDLAFEDGKADNIMKCIDELDTKLQGDPYLNILRAGVQEARKQLDTAEILYRKAMSEEPNNEDIAFKFCLFLIKNKEYDKAVALFTDIHRQFHFNPADFLLRTENMPFWQSAAYKNWEKQYQVEN